MNMTRILQCAQLVGQIKKKFKNKLFLAIRPPVEETVAFLKALLQAHGKDFLEKLFGEEARNSLAGMGGVDKVAVALSRK